MCECRTGGCHFFMTGRWMPSDASLENIVRCHLSTYGMRQRHRGAGCLHNCTSLPTRKQKIAAHISPCSYCVRNRGEQSISRQSMRPAPCSLFSILFILSSQFWAVGPPALPCAGAALPQRLPLANHLVHSSPAACPASSDCTPHFGSSRQPLASNRRPPQLSTPIRDDNT